MTGSSPQALSAADGVQLVLRHWPHEGAARGTVLLVHGLGEHIGRYEHVAAHLNAWGWRVAGYDQRGHGRSQGARGRLPAADALLDDLSPRVSWPKRWARHRHLGRAQWTRWCCRRRRWPWR
jgi:alpha-beta hydrolase superfamily lysophospholipase